MICERFERGRRGSRSRLGGNRLEGGLRKVRKVGEEEGRGKGWEVMEAMNGLDGEALGTRSATYSCLQTSQYAYCRKEFSVFPHSVCRGIGWTFTLASKACRWCGASAAGGRVQVGGRG